LTFEDVVRSQSPIVYIAFLSEYYKAISRPELRPVISLIWRIQPWTSIEFPLGAKAAAPDDSEVLHRWLPLLVTARLLPLARDANSYLTSIVMRKDHFLTAYKIFDSPIVHSDGDPDALADRISFIETTVPPLANTALSGASWAALIIKVLGVTGTPDLAGALITKLLPLFTKAITEDRKTLGVNATRLVRLVQSVALSPDVSLITFSQGAAMRGIFKEFFPWIHNALSLLGLKVKSDLTLDISPDALSKLTPLLKAYADCMWSYVQVFDGFRDPGQTGALRGFVVPPGITADTWAVEDRRKAFELLVGMTKNPACTEIPAARTLERLLQCVGLFDKKYKITNELYDTFLDLEVKNRKILRFVLLHHSKLLFSEFISLALTRSSEQGCFFFSAVSQQFCGTETTAAELSAQDIEAHQFLMRSAGRLLLLTLTLLSSPHEESRKVAYGLLLRISPLISAHANPRDLAPSAAINDYLRAHRAELCALAFPASPAQLFELSAVYASHIPALTHGVLNDLISFYLQSNIFVHGDPQVITSLLNAVAPFVRNIRILSDPSLPSDFGTPSPMTGFSFITNFFSAFPLLNKSNHSAYSRVFAELCAEATNVLPLCEILVFSGTQPRNVPAIQTALLFLVQSQPGIVLQLLTQPLTCGAWYNQRVCAQRPFTDAPWTPLDWLALSLSVLHEVAESDFTVLFPYLHTILHFALLHFHEAKNPFAAEISRLLATVLGSLASPVALTPDATTATLVPAIREQLLAVSPSSLGAWSREALQWGACCGHLATAAESCDIYAAVLDAPAAEDAMPLMIAIHKVMSVAGDTPGPHVWGYVRSALLALASIAEVVASAGAAPVLLYLFDFAAQFLPVPSASTATAALRVMSVFIVTRAVSSATQISPHLPGIAALLPGCFNDGAVARLLTALVVNLPPATAHPLKALSLAMLLPVLHSCACAYHSIDPFSTFVEDHLVLEVFEAADLIGQTEFAGDARYAEIFVKYFSANAAFLTANPPGRLIDELAAELWTNDADSLASLGRCYVDMCKKDVAAINAAIFAVADAFLRMAADKQSVAACFTEVLVFAAGANTSFGKALLRSFATLSGGLFSGPGALMAVPEPKVSPMPGIVAAVKKTVGNRAVMPEGDLSTREATCELPMIPFINSEPKSCEEETRALKKVRLQPFTRQQESWQALQKPTTPGAAGEVAKPTAFEYFAHSEVREEAAKVDLALAGELVFPPDLFALRDEELGDFEARIG
jgi:hypothetical protein